MWTHLGRTTGVRKIAGLKELVKNETDYTVAINFNILTVMLKLMKILI